MLGVPCRYTIKPDRLRQFLNRPEARSEAGFGTHRYRIPDYLRQTSDARGFPCRPKEERGTTVKRHPSGSSSAPKTQLAEAYARFPR